MKPVLSSQGSLAGLNKKLEIWVISGYYSFFFAFALYYILVEQCITQMYKGKILLLHYTFF